MPVSAFTNASLIIFEHLGETANYYSQHLGEQLDITVIPQPLGQYHELAHHQIRMDNAAFAVQASELEKPLIGDTLEINGNHYRVSQEPECDPHNLVWALVTTLDNE